MFPRPEYFTTNVQPPQLRRPWFYNNGATETEMKNKG